MELTENQRKVLLDTYCAWADKGEKNITRLGLFNLLAPYFDDFSVENDSLSGFMETSEDRRVGLTALAYLCHVMHDSFMHSNPSIQDYLAISLPIKGFAYRVTMYNDMGEEEQDKLEEDAYTLQSGLWDVQCHVQIGKELGLEGKRLGIYDALRGGYVSAFDHRVLRASRELSEWVLGEHGESGHQLVLALEQKITEVEMKYGFMHNNERLTLNYIAEDIMGWSDLSDLRVDKPKYEPGGNE